MLFLDSEITPITSVLNSVDSTKTQIYRAQLLDWGVENLIGKR
jgi:hypothetical protein